MTTDTKFGIAQSDFVMLQKINGGKEALKFQLKG